MRCWSLCGGVEAAQCYGWMEEAPPISTGESCRACVVFGISLGDGPTSSGRTADGGRREKYQMLVCVLYIHNDLDVGLRSLVSQSSLSVVATLSN